MRRIRILSSFPRTRSRCAISLAVLSIVISSVAIAGPITYLAPPFVSDLNISGGTFLPTSPPNPEPGNPPLASLPRLIVLPTFGFFQGIRTIGTLDFEATGGAATVSYVALRPFNVGANETDTLAIFYDIAYWSNLADTTATRIRYNAETFVPDIGLVGVGATVPASIPFNALEEHPPRPLFGTTLNDVSVNFSVAEAEAGNYILIQRVEIEFANLSPEEIIRINVLPVESSIRGLDEIPEPTTLLLVGFGSFAVLLARRVSKHCY